MRKIIVLSLTFLFATIGLKAQVELTSAGTGGSYTLSVPGAFQLRDGIQVTFKAHVNSAAGATMNVSGSGNVSIVKDGGGNAISAGDIIVGQVVTLAYADAKWQMITPTGTPAASSNDWTTTGNTGTNAATNFIGTTDATDLSFRTNNTIKAKLTQKGQIEILNTGSSVFVGSGAGASDDLTNRQNTFIGDFSGNKTTSGNWNTALGYGALTDNITGTSNTAIGRTALSYNTGSNNTATGTYALFWGTSGSGNTGVGTYSGQTITTGSNNTFLGYNSDATVNNLSNATAIGYNAKVSQNNSLILGNNAVVGIGTSSPATSSKLHVVGAGNGSTVNVEDNTLSNGSLIYLSSNSTSGTGGNNSRAITINRSGANSNASHTAYGVQSNISNTGTTSTNIALYGSATGATDNWAGYFAGGNVYIQNNLVLPTGAANNYVLSSDASGKATWTDLSTLSSGSTAWTRSGTSIYPTNISDFVGLGINTPDVVFHILGSSSATNINAYGGSPQTTMRLYNSNTTNNNFSSIAFSTLLSNSASAEMGKIAVVNVDHTVGSQAGDMVLMTRNASSLNEQMRITSNGLVGIGTPSPATTIDVANSSVVTTSRFANSFSSGTQKMAVYGWATGTGAGANLGGAFEATGSTATNYGVQGNAYGNSGNKVGVYGSATGTGTNTAAYFTATTGTNNYAIIVPSGGGRVGIGLSAPGFPLDVRTSTEDRTTYFYNDKNTTNTTFAVYGGAYGTGSGEKRGGSFESSGGSGNNIAVRGYALNSTANNYGLYGLSSGAGTTNYGVYGSASGATTNWAGYFIGNTYIQGRLGINEPIPLYELDVSSTSAAYAGRFKNEGTGGADGLRVEVNTTAVSTGARYGTYSLVAGGLSTQYAVLGITQTSGTTNYGVYGSASGGTTNYGVYCSGSGGYTGSWTLLSDQRFKENIKPLTGALDKILQLEPKTYNLKAKEYSYMNFPTGTQIGLISQEVEKIIPELVEKASHPVSIDEKTGEPTDNLIEFKSMNYIGLTPVLVQAIKEQQLIIEQLKARIEALEKK